MSWTFTWRRANAGENEGPAAAFMPRPQCGTLYKRSNRIASQHVVVLRPSVYASRSPILILTVTNGLQSTF